MVCECRQKLFSTYLVLQLAVLTHSLHGYNIGLQLGGHPHQPVEGLCYLQSPNKRAEHILLLAAATIYNLKPKSSLFLFVMMSVSVWVTNIKGVGYRQANQAAVQRIFGYDSKQGCKKHHQSPNELQTNGQPSAEGANKHMCLQI